MTENNLGKVYDYIVIGAGTAGCALAGRLAEDRRVKTLVLEAGPADRSLWFRLPVGYYKTVGDPKFDWGYCSEPEQQLNGRRIKFPRARVVGGCGAINGLAYIRGHRVDYDHWASLGNPGWSWKDVEPYFRRIEGYSGKSGTYGSDGPISIRQLTERRPICKAFLLSALACGLPERDDFNGPDMEGVGYTPTTVARGWRSSTSREYLRPRLKQRNLQLETEAACERVLFDGKTACGVHYRRGERIIKARAAREIILCAGAINSPQILQVSGIGCPKLLRDHHIPVVTGLIGVGQNLQDHFNVETIYELKNSTSLNNDLPRFLWRLGAAAKWLSRRDGPLVTSAAHVLAFARSTPATNKPDLQLHFIPIIIDENRKPYPFPGVSLDVCQLNPKSRGLVSVRSDDSRARPSIHLNYLAHEDDRKAIVRGLKLIRKIIRTEPFARYVKTELEPEKWVSSDDEFLDYARARGGSIYHPTGTCRMGSGDADVVDSRLRVRGVNRLRVADCSVIPEIIAGNTNAAAIMVAEKAADMIREDARETPFAKGFS